MKHLASILTLLWCSVALAAELLPATPKNYFNDNAGVVSAATATQLNQDLANFERQTGNQIVVAVYPKMQSDSSIEDFTQRTAQSWKVGEKQRNNGAVLFVFIQDRAMYIQVGYGLEGALPDALCKQIIENEITRRFRAGDFDGGLSSGVRAIMAATKGEYKGTGKTVAERGQGRAGKPIGTLIFFIVFGLIFLTLSRAMGRNVRRNGWIMSSGGISRGGYWGGGGSSGGFGGGGFSGGGGSFGGGGAGGRW